MEMLLIALKERCEQSGGIGDFFDGAILGGTEDFWDAGRFGAFKCIGKFGIEGLFGFMAEDGLNNVGAVGLALGVEMLDTTVEKLNPMLEGMLLNVSEG